ncbi:MAG: Ig-like domain-containing protein, partial [Clostridia bacterium]|nr:Ig-like domain-containing protein [Clostridia bacterium]
VVPIQSAEIVNLPENNSIDIYKSHRLDLEITADNHSAIEDDPAFIGRYAEFFDWSSSNPAIATVDEDGTLQPHSIGTTVITVSRPNGGAALDSFTLTVYYIEATGIEIIQYPTDGILRCGEEFYLRAEISPDNASEYHTAWLEMCWQSDNPDVLTVDPIYGIITAVGSGTAHITVEYYGLTDTIEITVPEYTYDLNKPFLDFLVSGNTHQLITNANEYIVDIEDPTVISADDNGVITALKSGTTKIYIGTNICEGVDLYEYTITVIDPVEWNYPQDYLITCGETYTITNNNDVHLYAYGTGAVQINNNNSITATDLGEVTIEASYNGIVLETIRLHILEGLYIVNKPQNNSISVGDVYESLAAKNLPGNAFCEAEWSSSDETIAEIYYDYVKGRVVLTGKSEGSVWIGAESPDPVNSAQDGFWLDVDLVPVESFEIVNHQNYSSFADHEAYIWDNGVLNVNTTPSNAYYNNVEWYVHTGGADSVDFIGPIEKGNMKLRVLKAGTIKIGAKIDGLPATTPYTINVKKPFATIENKPTNDTIYKNGTHTLSYDSKPTTNVSVKWYSSNKSIAEINEQTGKIEAKSVGSVTISIKVKYGDYSEITDSFTLYVSNANLFISGDGGDDKEILTVGETKQLTAEVVAGENASQEVEWISDTPSVATVDSNGLVTAHALGEVIISAKSKKYEYAIDTVYFEVDLSAPTSIRLSETSGTLYSSKQKKLSPTVTPSNSSTNFVWEPENPNIAYVSDDGTITAKNPGTTKIIVSSKRNPEVKAEYNLTVKNNVSYVMNLSIWDKYMSDDIQALADSYYGGDTTRIEHKRIITEKDFFDAWNSIGEFNGYKAEVDFVLLHIQASPFEIGGAPFPSASIFTLTREDLKGAKKLAEKEMKGLALFGCNAGHLDYHYDNIATVFANAVKNAPVIAADGTVEILGNSKYECVNDEAFKNLRLEIREPYGWIRYYWEKGELKHKELGFKKLSNINVPKYLE